MKLTYLVHCNSLLLINLKKIINKDISVIIAKTSFCGTRNILKYFTTINIKIGIGKMSQQFRHQFNSQQ